MMQDASRRAWTYLAVLAVAFVATLLVAFDAHRTDAQVAAEDSATAAASMTGLPDAESPQTTGAVAAFAPSDAELVRLGSSQANQQRDNQVLDPQELDDSTWAMAALAAEPTPASIAALEHVLVTSGDQRERMQAMQALEQIAVANGIADVRSALQRVLADPDPAIAERARRTLAGG